MLISVLVQSRPRYHSHVAQPVLDPTRSFQKLASLYNVKASTLLSLSPRASTALTTSLLSVPCIVPSLVVPVCNHTRASYDHTTPDKLIPTSLSLLQRLFWLHNLGCVLYIYCEESAGEFHRSPHGWQHCASPSLTRHVIDT